MKGNWMLVMMVALGSTLFTTQAFGQRFPVGYASSYAPRIVAYYNVNGVVYPVDAARRVWVQNTVTGQWVPYAVLISTPDGEYATTTDGTSYPAIRVQ